MAAEERERNSKAITLIEKATNSTDPTVDPRLLKAIKSVIRYSDLELRFAADTLLSLMKRPHSQIRYLSLLIIDEVFMRSKLFREIMSENMDTLLTLAVGFRMDQPLPPPENVAKVLRGTAIEFLEKWNYSFGVHYRQIRLGYDYLKNTRRFQFPDLRGSAERRERERRERERKSQEILRRKFEGLRESWDGVREGVKVAVDEVGACLEVLKGSEGMEGEGFEEEEDEVEMVRNFELRRIRLDALKEGEKVRESGENQVVFDALRELYKVLVTKHLVDVQEWISVLVRVEVEGDETRFRDSALKEFIDLKNRILAVKRKCEEAGCVLVGNAGGEADEDDDIWEEGKIEYRESKSTNGNKVASPAARAVKVNNTPECSDRRLRKKDVSSCNKEVIKRENDPGESNPLRGKLLAQAPVVNWGSALDDWGENRDVFANQRGMELSSHWGRVDYEATIPAEKIAELKFHATTYKEERPEIPPCRAPLLRGGLCERRDIKVCPFHGPVVARDDEGRPIQPEGHEKKPAGSLDCKGKTISNSPSAEELIFDDKDILPEQLAKQAVKNVRKRDEQEANKKVIDKQALKRARRLEIRKHNEAVLREAAMASTSRSAAFGEPEGEASGGRAAGKNKKPTLASMLRKKVTRKDRLSQKLLSTRVRDATVKQLTQDDDMKYRESFPNQW